MNGKCKTSNGSLACILPEGHGGIHLTDLARASADGRLYIVGFRDGYAALPVRQYVQTVTRPVTVTTDPAKVKPRHYTDADHQVWVD